MVFFRAIRRRLGLQRFKFGVMGVVAVGAEKINPLTRAGKVSHPFPVKTSLPIFIDISVTFATETVAFSKVNQISVIEPQLVPILGIVAIETPSHGFCVMELDVGVLFLQDPLLSIHFHGRMAVAAREHSLGHRWRHIFLNDRHGRRSEKQQQKQ